MNYVFLIISIVLFVQSIYLYRKSKPDPLHPIVNDKNVQIMSIIMSILGIVISFAPRERDNLLYVMPLLIVSGMYIVILIFFAIIRRRERNKKDTEE